MGNVSHSRSVQHRKRKYERKCIKCLEVYPVAEFSERGVICHRCKEASKQATAERRAKRKKYAGYTPALKRAVYKYREEVRQDYLEYQREYKRKGKTK